MRGNQHSPDHYVLARRPLPKSMFFRLILQLADYSTRIVIGPPTAKLLVATAVFIAFSLSLFVKLGCLRSRLDKHREFYYCRSATEGGEARLSHAGKAISVVITVSLLLLCVPTTWSK